MRSVGKGIKRVLGYGSPSPERDATGRIIQKRARSPSPLRQEEIDQQILEAEAQYLATQQQEIARQEALLRLEALQFMHNEEVNEIINSINGYLTSFFGEGEVNVDHGDPSIRYIVGMIVTSNNFRISAAQKLRRSRLLLQAVANVIINRARRGAIGVGNVVERLLPVIRIGIINAGKFLFQVGTTAGTAAFNAASLTGRAAFNTASEAASSIRSFASRPRVEEVQGRAASPPRQQHMYEMASAAYESVAAGLPAFYGALTSVLGRVYDLLKPCVSSTARRVVSLAKRSFTAVCAYLTPHQAVEDAVEQVVPEERNLECSICMTDALLGQDAVVTNCSHRYHKSCIDEWFRLSRNRERTCPYCRTIVTTLEPQNGGSKKYRSKTRTKSKSKSKSKSRRYLSKPHKSRKARKRVRHASSRRK